MSRIKMVLMIALLLAAVVTTVTTFVPTDSLVANACPFPNETIGSCHTNERDPNFSTCGRPAEGSTGGDYIPVCFDTPCSYTNAQGNTVSGTCCTGSMCYKEPNDD